MRKKVVVKIGGALNVKNGVPNLPFIEQVVEQISKLINDFWFILVLSGAIPIGISVSRDKEIDNSPTGKALYSMMGQTDLFEAYIKIFRKYGIKAGSGLYTTQTLENDFTTEVFQKTFEKNYIILANEADNVNPEELNGDNDPLAARTAIIAKADYLIMMTSIQYGIECSLPERKGLLCDNGVIKIIRKDLITSGLLDQVNKGTTSRRDSNGIPIKLISARDACEGGVDKVSIINGEAENALVDILRYNETIGTTIVP